MNFNMTVALEMMKVKSNVHAYHVIFRMFILMGGYDENKTHDMSMLLNSNIIIE